MTDVRHDILKGLARNPAAPNGVLLRLLSPEASSAWFWLCLRPDPPAELVDAMINHPDFRVRGSIAESWNADPADRARLVDDPEPKVRMALASGPEPFRTDVAPLPDAAYERLLSDPDKDVRYWAVRSRSIPPRIRAGYADHADAAVRAAVCGVWDGLTPATRETLLADPDTEVRRAAALRACVDDAALTDELVRLLTCEYQPSAPADALLAMVLEWAGYTRADMLARPQFLREGLVRYAEDENPSVRMLAVYDPDASPELIERLSHDASTGVRYTAAGDPRLPLARIEELLTQQDTAQPAAGNPALPVEVMHRLLDESVPGVQ
ncbi:hypothetical protein [Streptomyces sp. NBC_00658]|uniref:hypothetical protein n=1 Tax=Streptomyces sp. NBC_00658 TaxID=2975800 RepID=UPI00324EF084